MDSKKIMIKFLRPGYGSVALGAFLLAIGIIIVFLPVGGSPIAQVIVGVLLIVIGTAVVFSAISSCIKYSTYISESEANGTIEALVSEFNSGTPMFGALLRMGEHHIFGKKIGVPIQYSQITKVYQYVHSTNHIEDRRELRAATSDGKVHTLCKIALRGKDDAEVMNVCAMIVSKNPNAKIGYK